MQKPVLSIGRLVVLIGLSACGRTGEDRSDSHFELTIESLQEFRLKRGEIVRVEPNGKTVHLVRRNYHQVRGSAFQVPYNELEISCGEERYFVTNQNTQNNSLRINGTVYPTDKTMQCVLISFGKGVSVVSISAELHDDQAEKESRDGDA